MTNQFNNLNAMRNPQQTDPLQQVHQQRRQGIIQMITDYDSGDHQKILINLMYEAITMYMNDQFTSMEDQRFCSDFLKEITTATNANKQNMHEEEPMKRGNKKETK